MSKLTNTLGELKSVEMQSHSLDEGTLAAGLRGTHLSSHPALRKQRRGNFCEFLAGLIYIMDFSPCYTLSSTDRIEFGSQEPGAAGGGGCAGGVKRLEGAEGVGLDNWLPV